MRARGLQALGLLCSGMLLAVGGLAAAPGGVLKPSDVIFMYQADRQTYADYGATVLAWGGTPTAQSLEAARGIKFFGSVGMVTEFARYYERFPQSYEQGLCRDVEGHPVKVPWLTDHQHKGVPYWWCCTQQPQFRQYLTERVIETVRAGAAGLHIDDHLGTSGGLWLGLCFCDRCVDGFSAYLKTLPAEELQRLRARSAAEFNYREAMRQWLGEDESRKRKPPQHPLWSQWTVYQCRAAASFMRELRELAAKTAGHPVPVGANAGLLWPRHLVDYQALDLFSAETDHHAGQRRFSDQPLFAYRLAEAVQRPYAATASGGDWAFIKEQNLPGLVRGWIALAYAAGHALMAPHRQWCHTPEKGTHWYQGPKAKFAPLYQFVRREAARLDDYRTFADLAVVLPHRSFVKNPSRWFSLCDELATNNLSYSILLAGDELVDHPLTVEELNACRALLIPDREDLLPSDRQLLQERTKDQRIFATAREALVAVHPAAQVKAEGTVRVLPRVKPGSAIIHLLNYSYDAARDDVQPQTAVRVMFDATALGVPGARACQLVAPDAEPSSLKVEDGMVVVPRLGLWGLLCLERDR